MKPENVVFEGKQVDSTVKIIDFGRSKIIEPKMKIKDKAGTVLKILLNQSNSLSCIILHLK